MTHYAKKAPQRRNVRWVVMSVFVYEIQKYKKN